MKRVNQFALSAAILTQMQEEGWLKRKEVKWFVTDKGEQEFKRLGISLKGATIHKP